MHDQYDWQRRMKTIEREFQAIRLAADHLLNTIVRDGAVVAYNLKIRDIRHAAERLEPTYIIRLFAEFETGLRSAWERIRGTDTPNRIRDLLDGMASTRRVPPDVLANTHRVPNILKYIGA